MKPSEIRNARKLSSTIIFLIYYTFLLRLTLGVEKNH